MKCFILAAVTADGFIARHENERSFNWTSPEDKEFYVQKIKEAGCVVMGSKTFATFHRYPRGLTYVIYTHSPETFVNPKPEIITTIPTVDDPQTVIKQLAAKGHTQVAICGGSTIYTQFMKAGVVTDLYLTVEPTVFGSGIPLFGEECEVRLLLRDSQKLADNVLLNHYQVLPPSTLA